MKQAELKKLHRREEKSQVKTDRVIEKKHAAAMKADKMEEKKPARRKP